jgi:hypothetical protein
MIGVILKLAGYTYGPLLGLFAFGMLTPARLRERWVPLVAIGAPRLVRDAGAQSGSCCLAAYQTGA